MKKIKHSKYKNTGLLFEMLVRQLTSDALNNVTESHAGKLIKKYFRKNSELSRELELYNVLMNEKFKDESKTTMLMEAVLTSRQKMNNKVLSRQKYNLVKEMSEKYDINDFFKKRVSNYPVLASIYKLFEYNVEDNPSVYTKNKINLVEHITTTSNSNKTEVKTIFESQDKDTRELAYRMMVSKFNERYNGLSNKQKNLLEKYITEVSNSTELKEYIKGECITLISEITKHKKNISDKVVNIKLDEGIKILEEIANRGRVAKDNEILGLMNYYELVDELKKVA